MLSVYDLKGGVKWTKMLGQLSLPTEKPKSNALLTIVTKNDLLQKRPETLKISQYFVKNVQKIAKFRLKKYLLHKFLGKMTGKNLQFPKIIINQNYSIIA